MFFDFDQSLLTDGMTVYESDWDDRGDTDCGIFLDADDARNHAITGRDNKNTGDEGNRRERLGISPASAYVNATRVEMRDGEFYAMALISSEEIKA